MRTPRSTWTYDERRRGGQAHPRELAEHGRRDRFAGTSCPVNHSRNGASLSTTCQQARCDEALVTSSGQDHHGARSGVDRVDRRPPHHRTDRIVVPRHDRDRQSPVNPARHARSRGRSDARGDLDRDTSIGETQGLLRPATTHERVATLESYDSETGAGPVDQEINYGFGGPSPVAAVTADVDELSGGGSQPDHVIERPPINDHNIGIRQQSGRPARDRTKITEASPN